MKRTLVAASVASLAAGLACGPSAEEQEAQRAEALRMARADSVAEAEAVYDAAVFDTIRWPSPDSALVRGQVVWRFSCQKCHGATGEGDGELAVEHELAMPNILGADWEYAGDIPAMRHRIFVGHESEMPNWGLHGIAYRDIDAVTTFINERIREAAAGP